MNVSLSKSTHSYFIILIFLTILAVGGADRQNLHTHVNMLLFAEWELEVGKMTKSRLLP